MHVLMMDFVSVEIIVIMFIIMFYCVFTALALLSDDSRQQV